MNSLAKMKMWKRQLLRFGIFAVLAIGCWLISCQAEKQYLQSPQGKAVLVTSETIAQVALEAAAQNFGGPTAGKLASAGLDALASVLQGYIDKPVPAAVVKASPGIAGVGKAVQPYVTSQQSVTQSDVNTVYQAAAIAAKK
jgi:hypothetical protein